MKKNNRFLSRLACPACYCITAALLLTACHDDDNDTPYTPGTFSYSAVVFGSSDSQQLTLDSISSALTSATTSASWLKVTPLADLDRFGHPMLSIESTQPSTDGAEATIDVVSVKGDHATVTVRHRQMGHGDAYSGGNAGWLTDWWTFKTVELQGFEYAQKAPWTTEGADHIPEEVRLQVTPSQGWEMAFSYLNDESLRDVRYFALYNKWSGQMRVYTYIVNPTGWGSDLMINAYFGTSHDNDMYPLYNVLEYGIPTCHVPGRNLLRNAKIVSSQSQTFQTWLTPFRYSHSITPGWYCFEFDMSGYVPKGVDWLKKDEDAPRFKFFAETTNNQNVNLKGALKGSIDGTFTNPEIIQHGGANAASGIFNTLGGGFSTISGMASSSIAGGAAYATLMKNGGSEGMGSWLNPVKYWGGFACSIAGGLFNVLGMLNNMYEEPITYDTIPGKIDLTLDATLNLDGYIRSATGNSQRGLSVSAKGVYSANGVNGHVGKGVWSLAEDPVVYIDKDDIISAQNSFHLLCTKDGYSNSSFAGYDARIVYAFDPTSVKLNINDELFRDIQDVTVTANVGVFPNYSYGHTDSYRQMLTLGDRAQFSLAEGKTSGTIDLDGRSTPLVTKIGLNDLADGSYETADNCSVVTQKTADGKGWQRFHGRLINMQETGKQIIVDPQVYIPYSTDDKGNCTGIGYPTAPDFVVRIDVQFTALDDNGQRKGFQFSKLYIPQVKVVDSNEMQKVYARLMDYSRKCEQNEAVNTLENKKSVTVRYPGGHILIGKTLRMLKRVFD